jgi:hypothetical protein
VDAITFKDDLPLLVQVADSALERFFAQTQRRFNLRGAAAIVQGKVGLFL